MSSRRGSLFRASPTRIYRRNHIQSWICPIMILCGIGGGDYRTNIPAPSQSEMRARIRRPHITGRRLPLRHRVRPRPCRLRHQLDVLRLARQASTSARFVLALRGAPLRSQRLPRMLGQLLPFPKCKSIPRISLPRMREQSRKLLRPMSQLPFSAFVPP